MSERTPLTPDQERAFQAWVRENQITDVDHPDSHYDYRGYWKEHGNTPIRFGVDHFPDTYKQHGHPTFSVESKYSAGREDGGRWGRGAEEQFIPPGADLLGTSRRPVDAALVNEALRRLVGRQR